MSKTLIPGKSTSQIYKENHLLAKKILDLETKMSEGDTYPLAKFCYSVYHNKLRDRDELKKSIKLYENLRSDIDRTCPGVTLESIYVQKDFNNPLVKDKLLKEMIQKLESDRVEDLSQE